ncbi:hypothetical protein ACFXPA_26350 [Amycolatopsis sp. NPDC059090]|uniref:hypothetical protein n=1 Tax=unclassified Amycolatopsis TaxID=2618356 RepID=UPI003670744E
MCRAGGRRCNGPSCGAAGARQRQAKRRARLALEAAYESGDISAVGAAKVKYERVTGEAPPKPAPKTTAPATDSDTRETDFAARKAAAAGLPKTGTTEERIQAAVRTLARQSGDWIGLTDLREALGDIHPDELNRAMRDLSRTGNAHLVPESNRKALQQQDHDASIQVGGEANHLISIQEPQR